MNKLFKNRFNLFDGVMIAIASQMINSALQSDHMIPELVVVAAWIFCFGIISGALNHKFCKGE